MSAKFSTYSVTNCFVLLNLCLCKAPTNVQFSIFFERGSGFMAILMAFIHSAKNDSQLDQLSKERKNMIFGCIRGKLSILQCRFTLHTSYELFLQQQLLQDFSLFL